MWVSSFLWEAIPSILEEMPQKKLHLQAKVIHRSSESTLLEVHAGALSIHRFIEVQN